MKIKVLNAAKVTNGKRYGEVESACPWVMENNPDLTRQKQ